MTVLDMKSEVEEKLERLLLCMQYVTTTSYIIETCNITNSFLNLHFAGSGRRALPMSGSLRATKLRASTWTLQEVGAS